MKSEALVCTGIQKIELQEFAFPAPGPGEVVVETLYTLISPGTELRCLAGQEFSTFPFIMGYSAVGRVMETGPECILPVGQLVFGGGTQKANIPLGWGAHCRHALTTESRLVPLPASVTPIDALAAKLCAISFHGSTLGRPQAHEKVAVVGLGPIGYLAALCHALSGANVVGIDTEAWRVESMRAAGVPAVLSTGSITAAVESFFGQRADIVVDATGVAAVLPQCIDATKLLSWQWNGDTNHGARVLIQGSYPADLSFSYKESFVRELSILVARNHTENDLRAVIDLVGAGKLDLKGVISDVVCPEKAAETYQRLQEREKGLLTVAFQWNK